MIVLACVIYHENLAYITYNWDTTVSKSSENSSGPRFHKTSPILKSANFYRFHHYDHKLSKPTARYFSFECEGLKEA